MKLQISLLTLTAALFLSSCSSKPDTQDSHGNPITLSAYKGKWLVVNYWAEWCKPCLTELPDLNQLYEKHKAQVMVLGVNFDKMAPLQINQFAQKLAINFPLLQNFPIQRYGVTDINGLPTTFIINPEGKLTQTLHGPQTHEQLDRVLGLGAI